MSKYTAKIISKGVRDLAWILTGAKDRASPKMVTIVLWSYSITAIFLRAHCVGDWDSGVFYYCP